MNFEKKLNIVINEIVSVYNLSTEQANLIRQNIIRRVKIYQNVNPDFNNNETKIVVNSSDIGDFFINRLVNNIRNYDFDQTYNKDNTLKGAYTSKDQSLYIGNYKFIEDITLDKLQNRIHNVDNETLRKASLNVFNHELGHALQTSFKGMYGNDDNKYRQLINNLNTKYPNYFKLQSTNEMLTIRQAGMKVIRKDDKSKDARDFYAKNAYAIYLDEIFNEDEALRVTGVNKSQFLYNMGNGFKKNIYNYQSSNYKITSYGKMMKIVMGENLAFKAMYENSIVAYEFFDQFKMVSDKIYQGKPPMFNILNSLNKIKNESSLEESQKLDLFLTICLQKKVAHDLKNPNLTQTDITRIKNYISEFNNQMTKNPNLITEQDKIISNIKNMVIEREKQVIDINQNANIKKYSQMNQEDKKKKDFNYYFNEMIKVVQRYYPNNQMSEEQKKQLIGEIFYNETYLIESLNNEDELEQIMTRSIYELSHNEMQIRLQNIILTEIQEKYKKLHSEIKTQKQTEIKKEINQINNDKDFSRLIGQLRNKLDKAQEAYHIMMSDGYIDDKELATLIVINNKLINDGYTLKKLATNPNDIKKINVIISNLEEQQKKMNTMQSGIEEIGKIIR